MPSQFGPEPGRGCEEASGVSKPLAHWGPLWSHSTTSRVFPAVLPAVLKAEIIVPSILGADMDNPQLSTGEDLGTSPGFGGEELGASGWGSRTPVGQEGCFGWFGLTR